MLLKLKFVIPLYLELVSQIGLCPMLSFIHLLITSMTSQRLINCTQKQHFKVHLTNFCNGKLTHQMKTANIKYYLAAHCFLAVWYCINTGYYHFLSSR